MRSTCTPPDVKTQCDRDIVASHNLPGTTWEFLSIKCASEQTALQLKCTAKLQPLANTSYDRHWGACRTCDQKPRRGKSLVLLFPLKLIMQRATPVEVYGFTGWITTGVAYGRTQPVCAGVTGRLCTFATTAAWLVLRCILVLGLSS